MNQILDTNKNAFTHLKNVVINKKSVETFAQEILNTKLPDVTNEGFFLHDWNISQAFSIELIFNALNFCYWAEKGFEKWKIRLNNEVLDGSIALFRLIEQQAFYNQNFLNFEFLRNLTIQDFENIFKDSTIQIPMFYERYNNLMLLAKEMVTLYNGDASLLIKKSENCAVRMLDILKRFESFKDESTYNNNTIYFYKRAQLHVKMYSDILLMHGQKPLRNLHKLTAFADYKVPQILRHLGIFEYSNELSHIVDSMILIEKDSDIENEIRIATIIATQTISDEVKKLGKTVIPAEIDSLLWNRAASNKDPMKPYHRTYTIAY